MNLDVVKALQNPGAFWRAQRKGASKEVKPKRKPAASASKGAAKGKKRAKSTKGLRTPHSSPPASDDDQASAPKRRKVAKTPGAAETPAPHTRVCNPPIVYIFGDADGYQEWRIRKTPEFGADHIGLIMANEKVEVDQIRDSVWLHITTSAGVGGWAHTGFGKLTPITASIYPAGSAKLKVVHQAAPVAPAPKQKRPSASEAEDLSRRFEQIKNELQCDVCLGLVSEPVTTACGHTFCKECLQAWAAKKAKCPTCKSHVGRRAQLTVCRKLKAVVDLLS